MSTLKAKSEQNFKLFFNTRRHLLLSILLVWAIGGLLFFAVKPQIDTIFTLRTTLETERGQYQDLARKIQDLNTIKVSEQFQQKEKVDEVLPSYKPVLELLSNLHQAMTTSGVEVTALAVNPGDIATQSAEVATTPTKKATQPTRKQRYNSLKMDLTIVGTDDNVDEFIKLIERVSPFTSITELEIFNKRTRDGNMNTEAIIALNTYYYTQSITTKIEEKLPSVGEAELQAFETIQKFTPSGFEKPTQIESANVEDLFGIKGFVF